MYGKQSPGLYRGGASGDFQYGNAAGLAVMHGEIAEFCTAALRTVVVDADTAFIRNVREVVYVGTPDADDTDTGAVAQ